MGSYSEELQCEVDHSVVGRRCPEEKSKTVAMFCRRRSRWVCEARLKADLARMRFHQQECLKSATSLSRLLHVCSIQSFPEGRSRAGYLFPGCSPLKPTYSTPQTYHLTAFSFLHLTLWKFSPKGFQSIITSLMLLVDFLFKKYFFFSNVFFII